MTKRVFTYGCSVTQHIWPTWADIVLHSARINCYSVFNAGITGIGNTGIKRSVIETHEKYSINEQDVLLVMWTSWLREDRLTRYSSNSVPCAETLMPYATHTRTGNVLNAPFYSGEFVDKYFSLDHYIINSISEIEAVRRACSLNFEGHISIGEGIKDIHSVNQVDSRHTDSVYAAFNTDLCMPNPLYISDIENNYGEYAEYYAVDGHPVPQHALDYVQQYVAPHLPFDILHETVQWVEAWNNMLLRELEFYSGRLSQKRHKWARTFADEMAHYNRINGVNTSTDIWGGSEGEPHRVNTVAIIDRFRRSNQNKG